LLSSQLADEHTFVSAHMVSLDTKMCNSIQVLDQRMTEKNSVQDERTDEIGTIIAEHHLHFTEACQRLDRKFVDKRVLQDDCIVKHRKYFTAVCSKIDS